MYAYIYTGIYIYIYMYVCMYAYIYMHKYMHVYAYICVYECIYISIWINVYIYICGGVYGVFREWSVPLVRGLTMSFFLGPPLALNSHLWIPIAVACNSGHTMGTSFGELAKKGEGSRRVSNPRWVWIELCQPYWMRSLTPAGTSGRVHMNIQRL